MDGTDAKGKMLKANKKGHYFLWE